MSGRPMSQRSGEKREHRTVIRWTESEKAVLAEVREKLGLPYDVDVVRILTLRGAGELLAGDRKAVTQ